jgi:hypothetical protein
MKGGIRGRRMYFGTSIAVSMPRSDKRIRIKLRAIKHETKGIPTLFVVLTVVT